MSDRRKAVLLYPQTPARCVLTALLEEVPINNVMGMRVSDDGNTECLQGASDLCESMGWRSTLGSSYGPHVA